MGQLPTLTFNWHQQLASAMCACTRLFMYMTWARVCVSMCTDTEYEGQMVIYTPIPTVCLGFWCPGYDMNMDELEQKAQWHWDKVIGVDRCACVSVHLCVSALCQDSRWLVKGHQWPSPYPSLYPPPFVHLSLCPQVPIHFTWFWALCLCTTSNGHIEKMNTYTNTGVGGLFMNSCELLFWHSIAE